ncbi:H/ACA ribonucleoprotein complex subunit 2 [Angomonas deanei]|uniref:Ribosomal protein L7Ae/L30e/S12e/Gadd45 family, putative n=1 Tax=Angomonas deanei TaxID=59799 RepID=S9VD96_9TRYP|nr:H/ACA ribonucleoprotein complex subunit 2 [Angomonas deanei]EPY40016.1 H/ACA ribonucleoprotein complex subunit 2 [Angomonas deanei]EPY40902.1 H/ACA ribonucleoprotein complex subunit 2 [Angomonas deanei]EPY43333.1 H/ACA ribonucleoprotein complex subunit 2 [Angomonas deanei]CAD2214790.1 Ribosomal protein L7Ae/L30e/S12e/Gadd45 family, putative [Angomonas deanei]|eukprot:EPY32253.1 H/ACA ribonucleoprotein complex subunit 2 [Angomonas deanei]
MAEEKTETYDYDRELYRCPISWPLTSNKPKMTKKVYSLVKKTVTASKKKGTVKGIKDVTKAIRKGQKGILILGADASPYDVVSHFPVMAEEAKIPYVWVPSRQDLGTSTQCKRATSVVLVKPLDELKDNYDKIVAAIEELNAE